MSIVERIAGRAGVVRETGAWAWALQRLTAVLIGVFISVHLWVLHFTRASAGGGPITFESVSERMSSPWYLTLDALLLATVIYHSLNGVRAILLDWGKGVRAQKAMTATFVVLGVIAFAYGVIALVPFVTGEPLFS